MYVCVGCCMDFSEVLWELEGFFLSLDLRCDFGYISRSGWRGIKDCTSQNLQSAQTNLSQVSSVCMYLSAGHSWVCLVCPKKEFP